MVISPIPVAVIGAGGRMGRAIIAAMKGHARLRLHAALPAGSDPAAMAGCAVAIDFSVPEASVVYAGHAARLGIPLVIGTTGLLPAQMAAVLACARNIPILYAANMSLGVTLLAALVEQAARALGPDYDIEIQEMHHRRKKDAPSGTALMLGEAAARGRGAETLAGLPAGKAGPRVEGSIGFAFLRGGDVAGDHTVYFAGEGERLELTHRATGSVVFAQGAVRAAEWIVGREAGQYTMRDVLGL